MATNPRSWCRAFYKLRNFCEDVENNSTESFNSSINKAREKPFIPMLETIARQAMARIAVRSRISHEHRGKCTLYVEKKLAKMLEDKPHKHGAKKCVVTKSVNGYYESRLNGQCHRVSLENMTCSCMKWEITVIPCKHAYGVMLKLSVRSSRLRLSLVSHIYVEKKLHRWTHSSQGF
uniref:SWIM-type domain-containing protein n=1 Tax=Noccaea caerulescens TaxID=107243 RepID=A0A1J3ISR3_NOCCA